MLELRRTSGILLHISSLPGKYGIGDMGSEAFRWIDFLENSGVKYWQILPLNPTGYGNSPYQGLSAFAANPLFIDLDNLLETGFLDENSLGHVPRFPTNTVDFQKVIRWKEDIHRSAFENFLEIKDSAFKNAYSNYKEENEFWIIDFALFMALREEYQLKSWNEWPVPLRKKNKKAIKQFHQTHILEIEFHIFLQFIFSLQWSSLKKYANEKGIQIIGDIPIFMGYDCADVWAYPQLFQLGKNLNPKAVAGVPPDFFSKTGQLWGNPLYDWKIHEKDNFTWWTKRVSETLKTVDVIRLDHFRGFAGYYSIPAGAKTAESGKWMKGPGKSLFDAMQKKLGTLPFIAEDLGVITEDVKSLRDRYNFPGMRLFHFAFWNNADHEYLPHNYPENCVAYTGTHDNDTTVNWYKQQPANVRRFCNSYLGGKQKDIAFETIRTIWRTNAIIAIAPMQDFLRLGGRARMNIPATTTGNWKWRMRKNALTNKLIAEIKNINITYDRTADYKNWPAEDYFT